jgi:chromosome segregation ATPase
MPEMRELIDQCASQMRQFLGFGREAHVGSLTDLVAELSSNQARLSALNRNNEKKIQAVRRTMKTLQASVFQIETSRPRYREIKMVCGTIIEHVDELSAALSAAQERLGTELEAIFELAIKHDTPHEVVLVVKDLIDRSKQ